MARPDSWFRMYAEVVDDPKVQQLPDKLFKVWVNLLCVATRNGGKLPDDEAVAFKLRTTPERAREHIETFLKRLLFDKTPDGIVPHNWHSRQYISDVSTDRVKRFRDAQRNVSETPTEQSRAEQKETSLRDVGAQAPKPARQLKGTRLAPDWKPDETDCGYASIRGLFPHEIDAIAEQFRQYFHSPDATRPVKKDWGAAWRMWVGREAPKIIGNRSRTGRSASHPGVRQSVTAARDSILAKAGVRPEYERYTTRTLPDWPPRPERGWGDNGSSAIAIAHDGQRVLGPTDGTESPDAATAGHDERPGSPARGLPETADELPGGRGALRADDPTKREPVVAIVEGIARPAGDTHAASAAHAGGPDDGLEPPAFMERRPKLTMAG